MVWLRLATSTVGLLLARPRLSGRSAGTTGWWCWRSVRLGDHELVDLPVVRTAAARAGGEHRAAGPAHPRPGVLSRRGSTSSGSRSPGSGLPCSGFEGEGVTAAGVLFALPAAAAWAAYILLSAGTGRRWPGSPALRSPAWWGRSRSRRTPWARPAALLDREVLATGLAVGLLSSVVPYSLELAALRSMPPKRLRGADEPRAGGRRAGRAGAARGAVGSGRVARDRVRDRGQCRNHPFRHSRSQRGGHSAAPT